MCKTKFNLQSVLCTAVCVVYVNLFYEINFIIINNIYIYTYNENRPKIWVTPSEHQPIGRTFLTRISEISSLNEPPITKAFMTLIHVINATFPRQIWYLS